MAVCFLMNVPSKLSNHSSNLYNDLVEQGHIVFHSFKGILAPYDANLLPPLIRVLVVAYDKHFAYLLSLMVERIPGKSVVGRAHNATEAIQQFREFQPDVVLMELNLFDSSGDEVAREIHNLSPAAKIVLMPVTPSQPELERTFAAPGVVGHVIQLPLLWRDIMESVRYAAGATQCLPMKGRKRLANAVHHLSAVKYQT